ncbi:hypothetical protein [Streptomyces yanii]|uniref:hypothetical protein n=1 Tax=Streptomyces yanii TaxID=78510 RepID=UPI0031EFBAED
MTPGSPVATCQARWQDNIGAVYDGKVYSGFGYTGSADSTRCSALDPGAGTWTKLASAADTP